jgi:hypothetical protein
LLEPVNIQYLESHDLSKAVCQHRELPFKLILFGEPVLKIDIFIIERTSHNVGNSEPMANVNVDILDVAVLGQYHATASFLNEVYTVDGVTLKVDVLLAIIDQWLEKWADPGEKGGVLISQ